MSEGTIMPRRIHPLEAALPSVMCCILSPGVSSQAPLFCYLPTHATHNSCQVKPKKVLDSSIFSLPLWQKERQNPRLYSGVH